VSKFVSKLVTNETNLETNFFFSAKISVTNISDQFID